MESRTPKFTGLCLALYGIGAILVVYCGIQIKQQDLQYIPVAPFLSGVCFMVISMVALLIMSCAVNPEHDYITVDLHTNKVIPNKSVKTIRILDAAEVVDYTHYTMLNIPKEITRTIQVYDDSFGIQRVELKFDVESPKDYGEYLYTRSKINRIEDEADFDHELLTMISSGTPGIKDHVQKLLDGTGLKLADYETIRK